MLACDWCHEGRNDCKCYKSPTFGTMHVNKEPISIPMLLWCPECGKRHIDEGEFATKIHHTHSCQYCGLTWRPAVVPTCGVQFLPGFKSK